MKRSLRGLLMRGVWGLALLSFAASALVVTEPARAADEVPAAEVTRPQPGMRANAMQAYPYPEKLADEGFVEEEFLVAGTARPRLGDTWGPPAPYKTRILVRRPADPAAANGSAMLEWLNVTTGVGVPVDWTWYGEEVFRSGYVYVGVDAQAVGVAALRAYDPVRYGELVHPGDEYSYDILAQIAKAIRSPADPAEPDPVAGIAITEVYAGGSSQSCSFLNTYISSIDPIIERVIDGFMPSVCDGELPDPLAVPVLRINSLNEVSSTVPQGDFDNYRLWEVAGSAHSDKDWAIEAREAGRRDWGDPTNTFPLIPADYDRPDKQCLINRFPKKYAYRAGLHALDQWVRKGVPAPSAPLVERDANGVVRDERGNARGGLRLPAIEVPTAAYNDQPLDCELLQGRTTPFSDALLRELYPTKSDYVSAVNRAVGRALERGYLLEADAREIRQQAAGFAWTYVWHHPSYQQDNAALSPNPTGWLEENP